jgi:hypothetical protein
MAENPINKNNVDDAKEYFKVLLDIGEESRNITEEFKNLSRALGKDQTEQIRDILSLNRQVNKAIRDQTHNINDVLDNLKKTEDITKDIQKNEEISKKLATERGQISKKLIDIEEERQKAYEANNDKAFDDLTKQLQIYDDINEKLTEQQKLLRENQEANEFALKISEAADKKSSGFKWMENLAKSIPGLKASAGAFEKATEASRGAALDGKGSAFGAGIKELLGPLTKMSFIFGGIAFIIKFFVDAMFAADKRVTNIAKNLMISKEEARGVYDSFKFTKDSIDSIYNTTKDVNEAWSELVDLTDFTVNATKSQINAQIILTKNLGLSKEQALGVQEALAASNIDATRGKDIVYDQIAAFANQNKLITTGKKVFEDIAKTSKLIQINFNGNLSSLVKTTLEAKKLGLSLDQVSKIGSSLLDFESSISSQIEAELLTGRQINLEKARLYALNHDIAGLTQEITKQGITQTKFAAMNVVQQDAIAKSLGMSSTEMADMLYKQTVIQKTAGNVTKELREQARTTGNIALMKRADAIEQGILEGKTLEQAEKSTDAQAKFEQSLERVKEIFTDLVNGGALDTLANAIKQVADDLSKGKGVLSWLLGIRSQDQTVINRNLSNNGVSQSEIKQIEKGRISTHVDDFTITTNPKDTLVMAGGTKLGNNDELLKAQSETNILLKQLLAKDTNLYVDYNKFATAGSKVSYNI